MIDEVSHEMPDSYQRWRDEAELRARKSRERRAREQPKGLLPRTGREWLGVLLTVVIVIVLLLLLRAVL